MSGNDLMRRKDVEKFLCDAYDNDMIDEGELAYLISEANKLPAVPREMTAREFAEQMLRSERWCIGKYCRECKYNELCRKVGENRTKEFTIPTAADAYVKLIKQWAAEHPEEAKR